MTFNEFGLLCYLGSTIGDADAEADCITTLRALADAAGWAIGKSNSTEWLRQNLRSLAAKGWIEADVVAGSNKWSIRLSGGRVESEDDLQVHLQHDLQVHLQPGDLQEVGGIEGERDGATTAITSEDDLQPLEVRHPIEVEVEGEDKPKTLIEKELGELRSVQSDDADRYDITPFIEVLPRREVEEVLAEGYAPDVSFSILKARAAEARRSA
ncbi:MAG: hypothetical protein H0X39_16805 [Actinobacteria bacterium]|nr:hypothetical protein [Actinomycetota bacterium]